MTFQDIASNAGIAYQRQPSASEALFDAIKQQPTYTFNDLLLTPVKGRGAPGVAILDYDGDGDEDLYVTNGPGAANSLFANQLAETGQLSFVDVAAAAGVAASSQDSTGVCYGDIDNDGDPDLMVLGNAEPNRLFENQGDGTFLDISATAGIGGGTLTHISCSMGDVDGDGLLDIVVGNTLDMTVQYGIITVPFAFNQHNQLFVNQGGNSFVEGAAAAGLHDLDLRPGSPAGAATITWAIAMVDIDLDGDIDIVHGDDQAAYPPDALGGIDRGFIHIFENDGTGFFTDRTFERATDQPGAWMGLSFGDFDRDGRMDLFGSNFGNHGFTVFTGDPGILALHHKDSRWFLQRADGTFLDPSDSGLLHTPFGWGTSAADYDNDGDTDILFHGGLDAGPFVVTAPGVILENDGAANFHRDAVALAGSTDHVRRNVHGMAVGDLDGNGAIDIVSVSNFDAPPPIPLAPAPNLGGEFQSDAFIIPTFLPIDPVNFIFEWSGIVFPGGSLAVELNSGGGSSVQVEAVGAIGLATGAGVNRSGIGAVLTFTPRGGAPVMQPVLGGSSYASQDSLVATFGLGSANKGTVDVLWPGGTRNRLYDVHAGERVTFLEIPCGYDDPALSFQGYEACVRTALGELLAAGLLDPVRKGRFLSSAIRAYHDAH